jgi:type VI secretion system protein
MKSDHPVLNVPVRGRESGLRSISWVIAIFVSLLLAGCGTISGMMSSMVSATTSLFSSAPKPVAPNWKTVVVSAADDANYNSPIAMDLVFIKDQAVVDVLLKTSSDKWFSSRGDLQRSFPEALSVTSIELVPKQSINLQDRALAGQKALAAIVYADYPGPGEHRERLVLSAAGYVVQLGAKGFKVAEIMKP